MCVFSFSLSFGFITTFVVWELDLLLTFCSQYALPVSKKGAKAAATEEKKEGEEKKRSNHAQRILTDRRKGMHRFFYHVYFGCRSVSNTFAGAPSDAKIDNLLETQFGAGRLYAAISSRPGQVGRADGYILEGKELEVS
jgi:small subunit ribosomal protein S8e